MLQQLRNTVTDYANGDLSTLALQEWLVANVQAVLDSGDEEAIAIVNELEVLFARLSEGLVTEENIFDAATAMSRKALIEVRPLPTTEIVTTSSSSHNLPVSATQAGHLVWAA